jgi:EAL domain-containing protein (putative c-di-GMP-specific phosphodiesterase class I)
MKYSTFLDSIFRETKGHSQLRQVLFDGVTGLPILPLVSESLKDLANEQHRIGLIFLDTTRLEALEDTYGWESTDRLLNQLRTYLDSISGQFPPFQMMAVHRMPGDSFLLIISSRDAHRSITNERLLEISSQLQHQVNEYVQTQLDPSLHPFARVFNGHAILEYNSNVRFERLLARAVNQAFHGAVNQEERARQNQIQELQELVNLRNIRILFQPIVDLQKTSEILGYEALSRGPEGSLFESAEFMFTLASNSGMLNKLENLCQTQLIDSLQKCPEPAMVFVNLEPSFLENEQYQQLALFKHPGLKRENVVLEITERIAINDYDLVSRALESIRKMGYRIAVDDVGSGYASLQSIAYLKPDYIKVNEKMVNGISEDFIKQEIVKTLRDLGSRFSASLIAEGIEHKSDLETLQELNVQYGQGYFFQRPSELL